MLTLVYVYIRLTKKEISEPSIHESGPKQAALPVLPAPIPKAQYPAKLAPAPIKKGNRSFYGSLPSQVETINELPIVNKPSVQWQKKLKENLTRLGGEKLKTMQITPQESYIILDGNNGRMVERVIVKLESKDGEYTSFFAEVDSESGHVLKTWGVAIPEKARHRH